jgi:hypothetical protein
VHCKEMQRTRETKLTPFNPTHTHTHTYTPHTHIHTHHTHITHTHAQHKHTHTHTTQHTHTFTHTTHIHTPHARTHIHTTRTHARTHTHTQCRIAIAEAGSTGRKLFILFFNKLDLYLRKGVVRCHIWGIALYGAEIWTFRKGDQTYLEN